MPDAPGSGDSSNRGAALRLAAARPLVPREDPRRVMAGFSAGSVARRSPTTVDATNADTHGLAAGIDAPLSHVTEVRIHIDSDRAIVDARRHGRQLSMRAGFGVVDRAIVATVISELSRNILLYAARGDITVKLTDDGERTGVTIEACDQGPGIASVSQALRDGFSTAGRLGLGLPGIRRLADDLSITSVLGRGTTIVVTKWRR
jgi:serine/threonine-protein kinase RsbT